jgi:hypothetical protein
MPSVINVTFTCLTDVPCFINFCRLVKRRRGQVNEVCINPPNLLGATTFPVLDILRSIHHLSCKTLWANVHPVHTRGKSLVDIVEAAFYANPVRLDLIAGTLPPVMISAAHAARSTSLSAPQLKSLTIRAQYGRTAWAVLLCNLDMPSIETVCLQASVPLRPMSQFLARHPTICDLCLTGTPLYNIALVNGPTRINLPCLERLSIWLSFAALILGKTLAPNLTTLEVHPKHFDLECALGPETTLQSWQTVFDCFKGFPRLESLLTSMGDATILDLSNGPEANGWWFTSLLKRLTVASCVLDDFTTLGSNEFNDTFVSTIYIQSL